mmetsp:Transcript_19721/g.67941  ORF Transcript_19721/g.67941 Transcript_19721/m.67941 type:complete len:227 (-) Transcript_19721:852-1532(-)
MARCTIVVSSRLRTKWCASTEPASARNASNSPADARRSPRTAWTLLPVAAIFTRALRTCSQSAPLKSAAPPESDALFGGCVGGLGRRSRPTATCASQAMRRAEAVASVAQSASSACRGAAWPRSSSAAISQSTSPQRRRASTSKINLARAGHVASRTGRSRSAPRPRACSTHSRATLHSARARASNLDCAPRKSVVEATSACSSRARTRPGKTKWQKSQTDKTRAS